MVDAKIKGRVALSQTELSCGLCTGPLPRSLALSVLRRIEPVDLELQRLGQFEVSNILKSDLIMT